MKTKIITAMAIAAATTMQAQDIRLTKDNVEEVLKVMTLEEKATLLVGNVYNSWNESETMVGGQAKTVPGAAGATVAIPRLGIPETVLTDGPAGVRIDPTRPETNKTYYATGFPVGSCLASTWNTSLAGRIGQAIGNEVKEYNCDVILGPGVNIHRNPLCGRNFEYYSEDPYLTGKIAAAYINGVQSEGAGVSLKHYAVNSQETNRLWVNEVVSQRAAREIYLRGFEIAVRESHPWTVMSAYNLVNGVHAQGSYDLLTSILRDDWGFDGIVMTDWCGKREDTGLFTAQSVKAGNDLFEPGVPEQIEDIIRDVKSGKLSMEDVDKCVRRMLQYIVRTPHFNGYKASDNPDLKHHAQIARETAEEGIVLLKNRPLQTSSCKEGALNGTLPLDLKKIKTVALYGAGSYNFLSGGVGSGCVHTPYIVDLVEGLTNAGIKTTEDLTEIYRKYVDYARLKTEAERNPARWFEAPEFGDQKVAEMPVGQFLISKQVPQSDAAIITISRQAGEGVDRNIEGDFNLTEMELGMIRDVTALYHKEGKPVIVVINSGSVIETASWSNLPDAILMAWQPGEEGGNSVVDVLTGKVCPSGRLTMTWPVNAIDHPSSNNFPQEMPTYLYEAIRSGSKPVPNHDVTKHEEEIWVGYRYFDTMQKQVAYPFGYGLSYTDFEFSGLKVKVGKSGTYNVTVTVKNTGKVAGKEVAQVYVAAPQGKLEKPAKELKAFAKTRLLQPGESETLQMTVNQRDLASFDTENSQWLADKGVYTFMVGKNCCDIKSTANIEIGEYTEKVSKAL